MSDKRLLAIDQGTHSTRAVVFDDQGRMIAIARRPVSLITRGAVQVEQSADEILASVHDVLSDVLTDPGVVPTPIMAAGLATQRSSVIAWDRDTGKALSPVISWQDRRAAAATAAMTAAAQDVASRTGLRLSPHYGAAKLRWLLQTNTAVKAARASGSLLLGPLASYLAFHLLQHAPAIADHANASRTLLWNLHSRAWDADLLRLFQIPEDVLPACRPIVGDHGRLAGSGIPLTAMNGDQPAALYAAGEPPHDAALMNVGTGAFVLLPVRDPDPRPAGLLAGISHSAAGWSRYYLEGTVNGAAAALAWAGRHLGIDDLESHLPGWLGDAKAPPIFVNTVGGLGSPWWRPAAAPYFVEQPRRPADGAVAVVESIVFLLQANVQLMRRRHPTVRRIVVSGGLANLDGLCQRLADLSGLVVQRPALVETTARGIAWQAGGGPAGWSHDTRASVFAPHPDPGLADRYRRLIDILNARTPA